MFLPCVTVISPSQLWFSYPSDNCNAEFGIGQPVNVQDIFPSYLNHDAGKNIVQPYLNSTAIAQAAGIPFLMFETNSASCGGFPGLSDSFGAALWALDYGLQMGYSNFSGALIHVSGQDVYYNVSARIVYNPPEVLTRFPLLVALYTSVSSSCNLDVAFC
jgi:hypothetical protein